MSTTAPVKKVRKKIDKSNWECSCGQSLRLRKLADFEKFCPKCFKEFPLGRKDKSKVTGVALRRDKPSASSAMESKSGSCSKGGPHEWKFGKCRKCNKPQGRLAAGGTFSNPGQSKAMCKDGKKHRFKFSKCQKCGKSEFA